MLFDLANLLKHVPRIQSGDITVAHDITAESGAFN